MRVTRGVLIALLAGVIGLGAVAYAAVPQKHDHTPGSAPKAERSQGVASLPKPKITMHPKSSPHPPAPSSASPSAAASRASSASSTVAPGAPARRRSSYSKLAVGSHSFSVRSVGARKKYSKTARFRWQVLELKDFSITPQLGGLGALYPGAPAQALPLTITNPNPVPILVTSLQVRATADPPGCGSAENLVLGGSSASSAAPIKVPANGAVSLPAPAPRRRRSSCVTCR